jgi:hypothetical protein
MGIQRRDADISFGLTIRYGRNKYAPLNALLQDVIILV